MVHQRFEELWAAPHGQPYMIVVTTNAVSDGYGKLIMGAGSAAQARDVYPELTKMAFRRIKDSYPDFRLSGHGEDYGFLPVIDPPCGIGIFQTKRHFLNVSRLDTIQKSTEMLCEYAVAHPEVYIRLPFPGIGAGRWGEGTPPKEADIKQVLMCLPDNVTVVQWRNG